MKRLTIDRRLPEKLWKKFIDNKQTFITAIIMFLLPALGCLIKVWTDGMSLTDIKIAAMTTNDEAFYFKYVEGVVNYGHPMGFFGYNESKSLIGAGTTWSPLISLHWIAWGFLFGWNYLSPIFCNVVILGLALFFVAVWLKPTYFQTGIIAIFYLLYSQASYYSLATVPENFIYALLILFVTLAYKAMETYRMGAIWTMIGIVILLTNIRPYYLVLILIPVFYEFQQNRKRACIVGAIASGISIVGYGLISKYFCASYFGTSVVGMGLTEEIFNEGIWHGIKIIIKTLLKGIEMTWVRISATFSEGNYQGRMLITLVAVFLLLIVIAFVKRKAKGTLLWICYWLTYFVVRYVAIVLLYDERMTDAAVRHMFDFIMIAMIIFAIESVPRISIYLCGTIVGIVMLITQYYVPKINPQQGSNAINYIDEQTYMDIIDLKDGIGDYFQIDERKITYDNTVIWVLKDNKDDETFFTDWRYCYALPNGVGLSVCYNDYVRENFEYLKSSYLVTVSGADIDELCKEKGCLEIYNNGVVVIYNIKDRVANELNVSAVTKKFNQDKMQSSILVLGDSIFGLYRNQFGFCKQLEQMLDMNVYNVAVGGTSAALRKGVMFPHQAYSFTMISDAILRDNYAFLEYNVRQIESDDIEYIQEPITLLKGMNYDELDYILICYGTNDYFSKVPIESNWPQSEYTYKNALRKGVKKIKEKCPSAQVLLCSPIYGNYEKIEELGGDSDTYDGGYGTLQSYVTAMQEIAEEQEVIFVDAYNELEINADNWEMYSRDGVHPSYRGCKMYAELIAEIINK